MTTRPSFRPRPIDPSKPLPIFRSSKDLRNADDVVVSRALPQVGTGVEAAELQERHLQEALLTNMYGDDVKIDIPIPVFEKVQAPNQCDKKPFARPQDAYIIFDRSDEDLENALVDYDGDHEDETFVEKYNAAHRKQSIPLDMDSLERAMDILEKVQGRAYLEEEEDSDESSPLEKADVKKSSAAAAAAAAKRKKMEKVETRDSLVQFSQVRSELVAVLPSCTDAGRRELYMHWVERRLAHGKPFHRLYIKPPSTDNHNPGVAFRPRGLEEAGGGRRMNTYENFKRARLLREEFEILRNVMESVVTRERIKLETISLAAANERISCVANGGPRLASISRGIVQGEREGFRIGPGDAGIVVSSRDLTLPGSIEALLERTPFQQEKIRSKKAQRRRSGNGKGESKSGGQGSTFGAAGSIGLGRRARDDTDSRDVRHQSSQGVQQHAVDAYGYDEHANRFLKHMRYFAGGFMNYGVCPYDHRVFSAASERNTVKEPVSEPKPFLFPSSSVKFGSRGQVIGSKTKPQRPVGSSSSSLAPHPPGTVAAGFGARASIRKPRPMKVRGRVGRGGRIILDRVHFEPERGVKAASYPASVEMGGVFTAGLPLELAERVGAEEVRSGGLGCIPDLGSTDGFGREERKLVRPLEPLITMAEAKFDSDGRQVYWPSRAEARRKAIEPMEVDTATQACNKKDENMAPKTSVEELRRMPGYASRAVALVQPFG